MPRLNLDYNKDSHHQNISDIEEAQPWDQSMRSTARAGDIVQQQNSFLVYQLTARSDQKGDHNAHGNDKLAVPFMEGESQAADVYVEEFDQTSNNNLGFDLKSY